MTNPGPAWEMQPPAKRAAAGSRPLVDWVQITINLKLAQQQASGIGHTLPELNRVGGIKRRVLRFIARCILHVSRDIIINPQQAFNLTTLTTVTDLAEGLRVVEQGQRTVVNHLENDVAGRLRELEQTVERLKAEVHRQELRVNGGAAA